MKNMTGAIVIVPINDASDGDITHQPGSSLHQLADPPTLYLERIATLWMEERKEAQPGVIYRLDRLPYGYTLWQKPRTNQPKHIDRWLYGHPSKKSFDSPNRFFPHFLHLMETGDNIGCSCTVCIGKKGVLGGQRSSTNVAGQSVPHKPTATAQTTSTYFAKPRVRKPKVDFGRTRQTDDEGTPDVYRNMIDDLKVRGTPDVQGNLIDILKVRGTMDELIEERLSMDWRTERSISSKTLGEVSMKPTWVPRVGEVVLYVRKLNPEESIGYDALTNRYYIQHASNDLTTRPVAWEAGVVSQIPHQDLQTSELVQESQDQELQINYSGFRIEPIPDVQSKTKTKSLLGQHRYIPLHQLRPFIFWKELLENVPEHDYDASIFNATAFMSTFSLVEKYRFRGTWPDASVFCKAMYLSSELIGEGDVVRLIPKAGTKVMDVLKITSIQLQLSSLDQASGNDYDDGHPYNSTVFLYGIGYKLTEDADAGNGETRLPHQLLGCGHWVLKHDPGKQLKVSFNRVLGRFYEREAMSQWFPQAPTNVSIGLEGMMAARRQARLKDTRIRDGKQWFWAETRTDALNLRTFNGEEVSEFDQDRDPREMRKFIKIIEGVASEQERQSVKEVTDQTSLRSFGMFAYHPPGAVQGTTEDGLTSGPASGPSSRPHSRKRSHSIMTASSGRGSGTGRGMQRGEDYDGLELVDELAGVSGDGAEEVEGAVADDHASKRQRMQSEEAGELSL